MSMTRRGEDVDKQEDEPGRDDTGTRAPQTAPSASPTPATGVDDQDTESGGPTMPAGDQSG